MTSPNRRTMYGSVLLPHCIFGGEPANKAANSELEQVTTARRPASEKE